MLFISYSGLEAQTLSTQAEVDAWDQSITEIAGSLTIIGNDITNLDALSNLTTISGSLNIAANPSLTNINGLSNLTSISGYMDIERNVNLKNIDGLSNLNSILWPGVLSIEDTYVTNIDGLSNLTLITGLLILQRNDSLSNINGLSSISSLPGPGGIILKAIGILKTLMDYQI